MATVIAVDLDDVLCMTVPALANFHNRTYGTSLRASDFTSFHFAEVWGAADSDAKVRAFYRSAEFLQLEPMPGAFEVLRALREYRGFEFVVVTARQSFIEAETLAFLERHYRGIFKEVHFANHYLTAEEQTRYMQRSKSEIMRAIGAVALIEDSLVNVDDCARLNVDVLLYDHEYSYAWNKRSTNSFPPNVRRVLDWHRIGMFFGLPMEINHSSGPMAPTRMLSVETRRVMPVRHVDGHHEILRGRIRHYLSDEFFCAAMAQSSTCAADICLAYEIAMATLRLEYEKENTVWRMAGGLSQVVSEVHTDLLLVPFERLDDARSQWQQWSRKNILLHGDLSTINIGESIFNHEEMVRSHTLLTKRMQAACSSLEISEVEYFYVDHHIFRRSNAINFVLVRLVPKT